MKKKIGKDVKNPLAKKIPHPIPSFVPQTAMKNIQEQQQFQCHPSKLEENEVFRAEAEPFEIPNEWVNKSEEEFQSELTGDTPYGDPFHSLLESHLPLSLVKSTKNEFSWLRPSDYILNHTLEKEIQRLYPKKNLIVTREDIKQFYKKEKELQQSQGLSQENEAEENVEEYFKQDSVTVKRTIYKDFYKILEDPIDFKVVRFREREETDEEYTKRIEEEERMKAELLKLKSKTSKIIAVKSKSTIIQKPGEEAQDRQKIFESDPSNLDAKNVISAMGSSTARSSEQANTLINNSFLSWMSSIFQFILDLEVNDCVDKKSIFANIYPQKRGMPIYNPNGHYVVKLYFMGKARRIDIDDRMPCSKDGRYILPKCEFLSELWPALLSKALLKLNIYKAKHPFFTCNEEIVDTSYIYSLTGYHTELIPTRGSDTKIKTVCLSNLSDDVVVNKKKYVLCLNLKKEDLSNYFFYEEEIRGFEKLKQTIADSQAEESNQKQTNEQTVRRPSRLKTRSSFIYKHLSSVIESDLKKIINDEPISRTNRKEKTLMNQPKFSLVDFKIRVISNYAYSINDFFTNEAFNMNRLKPLDFSDLKRTLKDSVVVFKQLTQTEKKEYISQRKELKRVQNEIKNKRIDELKNEGRPYLIVKLKQNSIGQYKLNSILSYSEEEIAMAKKCLLNKWKYPPPRFFDEYFRKYNTFTITSNAKDQGEEPKKKSGSLDWTKETYTHFIGGDLSEYSSPSVKEPLQKGSGGAWMDINDFKSLFTTFLVLYNPSSLFTGGNLSVENNWNYYAVDAYEPLNDYFVFKLSAKDIQVKAFSYAALLIFQPNNDRTLLSRDKVFPYIIFDICDEHNNVIASDIKLNKFYSTNYVENLSGEVSYFIKVKGGIFPFGFFLQIYAEMHSIEHMSYIDYYKSEFAYGAADFKIEHPMIEKDSFYLLSRVLIEPIKQETVETTANEAEVSMVDPGDLKLMFNIKYSIKYLKPFFQIFLIKEGEDTQGKEVVLNELITLPSDKRYFAIVVINKPKYTLKEGAVDISIIHNRKDYKIEQIDNVDPYQISDYYMPNRHYIIFREIIYSSDNIYASLDVAIDQLAEDDGKGIAVKQKKSDLRLKFLLYQLNDEGEEINQMFSHGLKGSLINTWESFDHLTIHHLTVEGGLIQQEDPKKKGKVVEISQPLKVFHPFLFICYFEPDVIQKESALMKIKWTIRVFPSDNLCFIKDCSKENHEKELKDNWEQIEPGRVVRASQSRKRYVLETQIRNNKPITEEESKFIGIARERKITQLEEPSSIQGVKSPLKKQAPPQQKNAPTTAKKANQILAFNGLATTTKSNLNPSKRLPLEREHCSSYIKDYLGYAYRNRTVKVESHKNQMDSKLYPYSPFTIEIINHETLISEKNNQINERFDVFNRTTKTEFNEKFYTNEPAEAFQSFYKTNTNFRIKSRGNFTALINYRDGLKKNIQAKLNATKSAQDVISNYISYNYDINYMISVYRETEPVLTKENDLIIKLFALISNKKEDQIRNDLKKFTPKDKNNILKLLEDINLNQWKIKEEVIAKLKELVK